MCYEGAWDDSHCYAERVTIIVPLICELVIVRWTINAKGTVAVISSHKVYLNWEEVSNFNFL